MIFDQFESAAGTDKGPVSHQKDLASELIMRGGNREGAGRKTIEIDSDQLEKLCVLHCTDKDIAAYFHCTPRTIENRRKEPDFREAMERGRAKGRISLRRIQMKLAEGGNASMAIWLGKQLLGQRDVTPVELSGPNGSAVKFSLEAIDAILAQSENPKGRRSR